MTAPSHDDTVRSSFRRQVAVFSGPDSPFAQRTPGSLAWVEPLDASMCVLEVACGAAHVAEQIADHVRVVVGVDLTRELLDLGARRIADAGIDNVVLQEANAQSLPFVDASFDLVCCRSSLHHVGVPVRAVEEMVRVCRPGGRVAITDLIAPDPATREVYDDLHRRLDPSHGRAFLESELAAVFPAGVSLTYAETATHRMPLTIAVNEQSDLDSVTAALRDEIDGGPPTGFDPSDDDGSLTIALVVCTVEGTRA